MSAAARESLLGGDASAEVEALRNEAEAAWEAATRNPPRLPFCWPCRCAYSCRPRGDIFQDTEPGIQGVRVTASDGVRPSLIHVPFSIRMADAVVVALLYSAGCYLPKRRLENLKFNRKLWSCYERLASVKFKGVPAMPRPVAGIAECVYFDVSLDSFYTRDLRLHARVFAPTASQQSADAPPHRMMVYFHGGGMVLGDSRIGVIHNFAARLALATKRIVVSCDYRLAPEHHFPDQVFDAYDFLHWVGSGPSEICNQFSVDRSAISLCGDSSGASLALTLATLVRDGLGPDLAPYRGTSALRVDHLVLFYPMMFLSHFLIDTNEVERHPAQEPHGQHRHRRASKLSQEEQQVQQERKERQHAMRLFKKAKDKQDVHQRPLNMPIIPPPVMNFFYVAYVTAEEFECGQPVDRRLCPVLAGVHGLPHTVLVSTGLDSLHKEHLYLVKRFIEAGERMDYHYFERQPHGFLNLPEGISTKVKECLDLVGKNIRDDDMRDAQKQSGSEQKVEEPLTAFMSPGSGVQSSSATSLREFGSSGANKVERKPSTLDLISLGGFDTDVKAHD